jgi:two-component system OmpR family sensor kinase
VSLRSRLLIALVGMLAVGLATSAVVTHRALEHYLQSRLDQQVRDAHPLMEQMLVRGGANDPDGDQGNHPGQAGPDGGERVGSSFLVGTYGALLAKDGHRLSEVTPRPDGGSSTTERPTIGPAVLADAVTRPDLAAVPLHTIPGMDGAGRYRVLAERFSNGNVLVVAVPYSEMDATLDNLTRLELVVSLIVAAVLAGLAIVIVRLQLRPLTRMENTANAIAAGDLTRRVDHIDRRTEAGRLGLALNGMLGQIESAFRAREASELRLRRFAADASHELRTPLTSIRGYAEMFRRGAADHPGDLAMVMRRIEGEAERMGETVDDLLMLAQLDQGRPLRTEPVDLAVIARDAVADARAVSPGRPVAVEAPDRVEILGDEGKVRQAVGNLVRNAVVHTPPSTPIAVTVVREDDHAVVSVVDHGPGIDAEAAAQVFERFYRVDAGRARDTGGSGLGLSIVAAVSRAHGGTVRHEPTPGSGATFVLTLPVEPPDGPAAEPPHGPPPRPAPAPAPAPALERHRLSATNDGG